MKRKILTTLLILSMMGTTMTSCSVPKRNTETTPSELPQQTTIETTTESTSATLPSEHCVNPAFEGLSAQEICALLSLEEKASQMIQGANYNMSLDEMRENCYGSVLSHESQLPAAGNEEWMGIVYDYQDAALLSDIRIPYIYANDCVHGVNEASGSVIFPHNINVGAAQDEALAYEMGVLNGSDMLHCGFMWTFSPCVASAQDPRWGRTYESYSSDEARLTPLAVAYTKGLLSQGVIPCAKHFFADGYAKFGTGEGGYLIDRGDAVLTDEQFQNCMSVYKALIDAGMPSIMLSHSSLNGVKMHENKEMIDYLRNELGFQGVIISDWGSLYNCSGSTAKENVILCVNAGCDMFMEETNTDTIRDYIVEAVNEGSISMERVDEAVTRIIQMKLDFGMFDDPFLENRMPSYEWNSNHAHEVARELGAKSMVPIILPEDGPITLSAGMKVFVAGPAANDSGVLCGGWTYLWQGLTDRDYENKFCVEGPTILEALQENAATVGYEIVTDETEMENCDVILLCLGEYPYAEWYGDAEDLSLTGDLGLYGNDEAIDKIAAYKKNAEDSIPVVTLLVAGRNVIIEDYKEDWDEVIMCYLPGSEGGNAVVDILTGAVAFNGTLPMPYYSSEEQIGTEECWLPVGYSAAIPAEPDVVDEESDN